MNLNDEIIVTLTDSGVKIYKEYCNTIYSVPKYYFNLKDNVLTIQMWEFANIFGKELWNGNPTPPCEMEFQFVNQIKTHEE